MLSRRTVSLLIRPRWIEAVELRQGWGRKWTLTKCGRMPVLNEGPEQLISAIQGALEAAKIRAKEVVLGLPSSEVLLRHFILPQMPESEWRSAIQFEVRKYIPFKVDDLVWNFHVVEQPQAHQLGVVFVGAQRVTVAHYTSLLARAGLKARAIESPSVGLARMILRGQPGLAEETFAVAEISGDAAHIILVKDGVPYFSRDVSLAGRDETKPIEDFLSTSGEAPAATAAAKGDDRLDVLLSELHYSFNYFLREFPADHVGRLFLCGEPVGDEWLELLTKELRLAVERTPVAFLARALGASFYAGAWATSIGLAMPGMGKHGIAMPLAWRADRREWRLALAIEASLRRLVLKAAAAAVGLLIATAVLMRGQVVAVQRQAELERQQRPATAVVDTSQLTIAELQALVDKANQRSQFMRRRVEQRILVTPKLEGIARSLPDGTWLSSMTYETIPGESAQPQHLLALRGYCFLGDKQGELAVVTSLSRRLKENPMLFQGFTTAKLTSVRSQLLEKFQVTSFEVSCASGGDGGS
ncbi:MAG: pilus assembly protein PilM [Candidatus Omnitrophica bacterium]|nr:pilus assembly protein PilM [Candidatus Omnitrophota bacterium]